mmetsp:Transcript_74052/g.149799  ORF Transcript_74052/g.149799 Transcript_74052/m.149799 type:complete len:343 (+) Transcript_74052:336-1364(+)
MGLRWRASVASVGRVPHTRGQRVQAKVRRVAEVPDWCVQHRRGGGRVVVRGCGAACLAQELLEAAFLQGIVQGHQHVLHEVGGHRHRGTVCVCCGAGQRVGEAVAAAREGAGKAAVARQGATQPHGHLLGVGIDLHVHAVTDAAVVALCVRVGQQAVRRQQRRQRHHHAVRHEVVLGHRGLARGRGPHAAALENRRRLATSGHGRTHGSARRREARPGRRVGLVGPRRCQRHGRRVIHGHQGLHEPRTARRRALRRTVACPRTVGRQRVGRVFHAATHRRVAGLRRARLRHVLGRVGECGEAVWARGLSAGCFLEAHALQPPFQRHERFLAGGVQALGRRQL